MSSTPKPSKSAKPAAKRLTQAQLARRLDELSVRLSQLELGLPATRGEPGLDPERFWVVDRLSRQGGGVAYGGLVALPGGQQFAWQREASTRELFEREWPALDQVLAALGHPVRLALLKALLEGQSTKAQLEKLEGLGTTGQLYHHLRILEQAGWARALERGVYGVPGERVVPLMAILVAAAG